METANSPLTSNDAESSSVQSSRKFTKLISEAKSLVAFAIFSVTLYLTAIAVFHRPLVSLPFSPRIIPESNHTEAGEPPDRENYIASVFSLIVMLIGSIVFGYLVDLCRLPPLLEKMFAIFLEPEVDFT
ncbi:unnamed protein product [Anisakis simplex]|uniref:Transmembrane protein n=1 Tax=Anisakis simplex TaxID=6269 RepID=A0A0M3KI54_ANISI|nr:unnamed protein product [Anisakis simplex]